jgi:hypothetical protein
MGHSPGSSYWLLLLLFRETFPNILVSKTECISDACRMPNEAKISRSISLDRDAKLHSPPTADCYNQLYLRLLESLLGVSIVETLYEHSREGEERERRSLSMSSFESSPWSSRLIFVIAGLHRRWETRLLRSKTTAWAFYILHSCA